MNENPKLLQELTEKIKPCDTDNPYVFISYSSQDSETVFRDVIEFQKRGYNVWIDVKNVDKTKPSWKTSAIAAVSDYSCSLLVFYVSENSLTSKNCYEEVIETLSETTYENHYGYINILCIDVCVIQDITKLAEEIKLNIKKSDLNKEVKQECTKYLTRFMTGIFNNNNERSRALSADNPGRTVNYYKEITQSFPEETLNASIGSAEDGGENGSAAGETKSAAVQQAKAAADGQQSGKTAESQAPGVQKITYSNGVVYEGELKDGMWHGKGKMTFTAGDVYEGSWENGKRSGQGSFYFADGSYYTGEFKNGSFNGQGEYHYKTGNIYKGEFKNGKRSGKGVLTFENGCVYDGEWENDKYSGMGTFKFADGRYYTGKFSDNAYNGTGEFHYTNGDVYRGSYRGGKRDGKGIFTFAGGNALYTEGEYAAGNLVRGKTVFRRGDVYEGEYRDGKRNGKGKFTFASGNVYEGDFRDDKFEGKGTFTYLTGKYYTGDMANNRFNGHGELHYPNGSVFVGEFRDSMQNGRGTFTNKDGKKTSGVWENDKLVAEDPPEEKPLNGTATQTFEDGSTLYGNFINGRLEGTGRYEACRNGKIAGVYEGKFKHSAYDSWGSFNFADGRRYVGGFMNNLAHGHGTYTIPKGTFVGDKYYASDYKYEGDFIEGKFGGEALEIPHP